jgi:hypothetical protein
MRTGGNFEMRPSGNFALRIGGNISHHANIQKANCLSILLINIDCHFWAKGKSMTNEARTKSRYVMRKINE